MGTRKPGGGTITCGSCRKRTGKGPVGSHWICRDCRIEPGKEESDGR